MARLSFRTLIQQEEVVYAPGAWDALSALLIQQAGFKAICASGYAVAAGLGLPDLELYSMTENLEALRRIAGATEIPIIADIDTGYGNAVNAMRTIQLFEAAGAGAIFMEDQAAPKRCPILHAAPPPLLPLPEAVGKVKAALDARRDPDTVIVARTDARGPEAIERTVAYAEAGADMILPTSVTFSTIEEFRACHEATGKPLVLSLTPGGMLARTFTPQVLRHVGCKVAFLPFQVLYAGVTAMRRMLGDLRVDPNAPASGTDLITNQAFSDLIGFHRVEELMAKYLPEGAQT